MVIDLSSDSSSSSDSSTLEGFFQQAWNRRLYRIPIDVIEPADPDRDLREVTSFDPDMTEPETSNLAPGPYAGAPEEVRGRRRPMRPCPFLGQYFSGTPAAYAEFKRVFSIPPDVEVRLLRDTDPLNLPYTQGELIFPLMAITEGGVRFLLHQFVRRVLRAVTLTSSQLTVNSYRIITSIIELRRQYNLAFGLEELFGVYSLGINQECGRHYLSCRADFDTFLIDRLPDSEEWAGIYVAVSGNFMFGPGEIADTSTSVQFEAGKPAEGVVAGLREKAIKARIDAAYAIPLSNRYAPE
ncbi:hypothetical protein RHMOL_Rhmol06G0002800 [Rhododendron molle]|uniref:Uncharacterized protein n=1 Tax=Rhododendron molle TaxID=49168 RepID=A0ACC0N975_RHOML|nr:hypothetical protein RHMOL_Rhmol06G0002800 [Rhododendron molle]